MGALERLVKKRSENIRATIGHNGGIERLVASLKRYPMEHGIQAIALVALSYLALQSTNRSFAIVQLGGIDLALRSLSYFRGSLNAQGPACSLLANLVRAATSKPQVGYAIVEANGI